MELTQFETLLTSFENSIFTITLNRPETYNALSVKLLQELLKAFQLAHENPEVRVVVLTGAGEKSFCSGADLKEGFNNGQGMKFSENLINNYNPLINAIRNIPKPVICRLNGIAAGAGSSIALACDIVIATEDAAMSQIFIKIGLVPDAGASYILPRLVGSRKAFELFTSGRTLSANECEEFGLVNMVVSNEKLNETVENMAISYATAPTKAIGLIKNMLNKSQQSSLEEMLALEAESQDIAGLSNDAGEGIFAFLQKRKAVFKGK